MSGKIEIRTKNLDRIGIPHKSSRFESLSPPLIMGVLNVTPDSFSDGGRFRSLKVAIDHAMRMVDDGADIIDVGGESTRPFAEEVSLREEKHRVIPVIKELAEKIDVPISVDTRHTAVAYEALDAGASMVNDVNGLREPGMEELVIDRDVNAVIMHMKGNPSNMQLAPSYEDTIGDIHRFLEGRVNSLVEKGCDRDALIIDPGIGFGKRVKDNLEILRNLEGFLDIGCPILVGASRKSFIGKVLETDIDQRLEGSIASAIVAFMNGASILRVHDVKETGMALELVKAIMYGEG